MSKPKSYPPLSDVYRTAWESCLALWPLFFIRLGFLILNIGALVLCLFLACWPFIQALINNYRSSGSSTFDRFLKNLNPADMAQYFPDFQTIMLAVGLGLLYITWWIFLAALFDGGMYACLRGHQKNEEAFSFKNYFLDGFRYMFPMIGLWIVGLLLLISILLAGFLLFLVLMVLFKALSIPWWIGIILGIPAGFSTLVLLIALGGYVVVSGAYLVEDKGVMSALKRSFEKCLADHGRVVWGILLVWVIYFVFSIAFQGVMAIFGAIPLIGLLFSAAEFIINIALSIAIWVYMPALAVAFSLEKES